MRWVLGLDSAEDSRKVLPVLPAETLSRVRVWFRYLTDGGVGATPLTTSEIDELSQRQIRVLPVWNRVEGVATAAQGIAAANAALEAIRSLQRPLPVVFADIEYGTPITADWLEGWHDGCTKVGLAPGVYANMGSTYWLRAWTPLPASVRADLVLWTADWLQVRTIPSPTELERWAQEWQSCQGARVHAWQVAGNVWGVVDVDLVSADWLVRLFASPAAAATTLTSWSVRVFGAPVQGPVIDLGGHLYVGVRELAQALGAAVMVDQVQHIVSLVSTTRFSD